jgi:hypothetical protein
MNKKLAQLQERRQKLVTQAAEQRIELAQNFAPLHQSIAMAETALAAVRYVKKHPILMLGGTSLIALLRPTRLGKWLQRGWVAFEIARNLSTWLKSR